MKNNEKRIVRKSYKNLTQTEIIRLGNSFVDDFLFEDNKAVDIPINALRTIFNIAADLRNEQLRPQDRPMQLSLFEEEFEPLKTVLKKKNYFAKKNKLRTATTSVTTISFLLGRKIFSENSHKTINRHQQYHCNDNILKIKHFFNYLKI